MLRLNQQSPRTLMAAEPPAWQWSSIGMFIPANITLNRIQIHRPASFSWRSPEKPPRWSVAVTRPAKVGQQSHNPSLFWHRDVRMCSPPMSGLQSRSPTPASDSRFTCSEFTWTLSSLSPYPPPPLLLPYSPKNTPLPHLLYVCLSWSLMYALIV